MASRLRELDEFSRLSPSDPLYIHQDPMPAGADIMTQQEAISELSNREMAASAVQFHPVSPFESSWNPTNPNFRATAQNAISNMLGGSNIASSDNYWRGRVANTLTSLLDFVPLLGDGMGIGDTMNSYRQGDMLGTGINALATGVGVLPLVGDVAAKGAKSALRGLDSGESVMQPKILIPDVEEGRRRLYNAGTIDRDPQGYLEPHTSDWVKEVAEGSGYEGDIEDITSDLVYMSDKPDWVASIISRNIGKDLADVTVDDVRRYGRLNIIDAEIDADEIFQIGDYNETRKIKDITGKERNIWDTSLYDDDRFDSLPIGPEPDDFISNEPQEITYTLTGDDLVDFLNENQPEMMQRLKGGAALSGESALRGLDMNPEARMQRAQDLGFDTDNVFYHGTASDFAELQPSTVGDLGGGVYVTPNPEKASGYAAVRKFMKRQTNNAGPNVLPLRVKSNLNYLDLEGRSIMPFDEARIQSLKDQGYEGIRQFDADGNVIQMNIFDPKNIRSTNAEFDPAKADSADLLSSISPTQSSLRNIV